MLEFWHQSKSNLADNRFGKPRLIHHLPRIEPIQPLEHCYVMWEPPPLGWLKVNVGADLLRCGHGLGSGYMKPHGRSDLCSNKVIHPRI